MSLPWFNIILKVFKIIKMHRTLPDYCYFFLLQTTLTRNVTVDEFLSTLTVQWPSGLSL